MKKNDNDIAIVGIGCHFPKGAHGPKQFWELIKSGYDGTSEVSSDRWNVQRFYDPNPNKPGKTKVNRCGFLDEVDRFDPEFFGISPREADYIDPQQRLLIQTTWEAFEDCGYIPAEYAGKKVGVFIGGFTLDYKLLQFSGGSYENIDVHTATGTMMTMLSNRISYIYDFCGPSLSIDTACSSSLVATHYACQSLINDECTLAVAGGVLMILTPQYMIAESKGGFLCPDGHCKTFDASANGYARGEGAGVVLLKRLDKAIEDGDQIYSVICGSGVNQDGHTSGITVPNGEQQKRLLEEVYKKADIAPSRVNYVEAHGTGTALGDPIEANALGGFFSTDRPASEPCIVGSVKPNIGHLEAASGVAGLIKTSLSLKHKMIPPNINFNDPNPKIDFETLRLKVPTSLEKWPDYEGTAIAGVNSFGFGGTNAHIILKEAPDVQGAKNSEQKRSLYAFPFSAKSAEALKSLAGSYCDWLESNPDVLTSDLYYSLACRRQHHDCRLGIVAGNTDELKQKLQGFVEEGEIEDVLTGMKTFSGSSELAFVFTGMGPQWWAMGRELFENSAIFKKEIERCDAELKKHTSWSLIDELSKSEENHLLGETQISQPANFAIQVGLLELWKSFGIVPKSIIGHSTGEVAAFYAAGVLSFEDAIKVIYARSFLQQKLSGRGKMAALALTEEEANEIIAQHNGLVSIAAINSPKSVTLSGDGDIIDRIAEEMEERKIFCRLLRVDIPYHSYIMDEILDELSEILKDVESKRASIDLYSTVTGKKEECVFDYNYWRENVREPVRFADSITAAIKDGINTFLEIGPHPVLASSISECATEAGQKVVTLYSLKRKTEEERTILAALAGLYVNGADLPFKEIEPKGEFLSLPLYPWQNEQYWMEMKESHELRVGEDVHPLLGRRIKTLDATWEGEVSTYWMPYFNDHIIQNNVIFPGAGYVELGMAAIKELSPSSFVLLEDLKFHSALFIAENYNPRIQVTLDRKNAEFKINTLPQYKNQSITLHASGRFRPLQCVPKVSDCDFQAVKRRCGMVMKKDECYSKLQTMGFAYGQFFQGITDLWVGENEALARIQSPDGINASEGTYYFHPVMLDTCFQAMIAVELEKKGMADYKVKLPIGIERLYFLDRPSEVIWAHTEIIVNNDEEIRGNICLYNSEGKNLGFIEGFVAHTVEQQEKSVAASTLESWLYQVDWSEKENENSDNILDAKKNLCLIMADKTGMAENICTEMDKNGIDYVLVYPSDRYTFNLGEKTAYINAESKEDYTTLVNDIVEFSAKSLITVIHLWNLDAVPMANITETLLDIQKVNGVLSAVYLAQALGESSQKPKCWFVTRGSQDVDNTEGDLAVSQASVWGLGRVFGQQEYIGMWGGLVDLDPKPRKDEVHTLLAEVFNSDGEDNIAIRSDVCKRWVARLNHAHDLCDPLPVNFRSDGSYIVTGAFGAIGEFVTLWLAQHGARNLILMSRKPLPRREEWKNINPDTQEYARIKLIQSLENMGSHVILAAVDVSDKSQLEDLLNKYSDEGRPPIRGVFHVAGIVEDRLMTQMTEEIFSKVYRPKVMGSWLLHSLLKDEPIEHFVMFSSIASLVTSSGQCNYAAGNAFLDALAMHRRREGLPGLSINWGPWAVGMVKELNLIEHYKRRGMDVIGPKSGIQVLEHMLGQRHAQIAVVSAEWPVVLTYYPKQPPLFHHLALEDEDNDTDSEMELDIRQQLILTEADKQYALVEDKLINLVVKVLRLRRSNVDASVPLNSVGIDSMLATEMHNRIELVFGISVLVVDLLGNSTVSSLTEKLLEQMLQESQLSESLTGDPELVEKGLEEISEISDQSDIEKLLGQIENLSDQEAESLTAVDTSDKNLI